MAGVYSNVINSDGARRGGIAGVSPPDTVGDNSEHAKNGNFNESRG